MNVQTMSCPNCGGAIAVTDQECEVRCDYCGKHLNVDRGDGYASLKLAQNLGRALQDSNAETQGSIRVGTLTTQVELQRLQINQQLTAAQFQLASVQSEIRSLEREKPTRTTKEQLRQVRVQESDLRQTIRDLNAALQPVAAQQLTSAPGATASTRSTPATWAGDKPWYRRTVWLWVFLIFFYPAWALVIVTEKTAPKLYKIIAWILLGITVVGVLASLASGG